MTTSKIATAHAEHTRLVAAANDAADLQWWAEERLLTAKIAAGRALFVYQDAALSLAAEDTTANRARYRIALKQHATALARCTSIEKSLPGLIRAASAARSAACLTFATALPGESPLTDNADQS